VPDFRRWLVPGGTYFFTIVTAGRSAVFSQDSARRLLGTMMRQVRAASPFTTVAVVLLPDHLHAIWTLPAGDHDYSARWQAIKAKFSSAWLAAGGSEERVTAGYDRQRRRGVWQPRFMEHTIRDERDLHNHADYIHYNPVKHGYARRPWDWPWSSFRRFVQEGEYPRDWGSSEPACFRDMDLDLIE